MNTSKLRTVGARCLFSQISQAAQNGLRRGAWRALAAGLALWVGVAAAQQGSGSYPATIEAKSVAGGEARIDVLGERYAQLPAVAAGQSRIVVYLLMHLAN